MKTKEQVEQQIERLKAELKPRQGLYGTHHLQAILATWDTLNWVLNDDLHIPISSHPEMAEVLADPAYPPVKL